MVDVLGAEATASASEVKHGHSSNHRPLDSSPWASSARLAARNQNFHRTRANVSSPSVVRFDWRLSQCVPSPRQWRKCFGLLGRIWLNLPAIAVNNRPKIETEIKKFLIHKYYFNRVDWLFHFVRWSGTLWYRAGSGWCLSRRLLEHGKQFCGRNLRISAFAWSSSRKISYKNKSKTNQKKSENFTRSRTQGICHQRVESDTTLESWEARNVNWNCCDWF